MGPDMPLALPFPANPATQALPREQPYLQPYLHGQHLQESFQVRPQDLAPSQPRNH